MYKDKKITVDEALARLSSLCAGTEKCENELRAKLVQWGMEREQIETVLHRLVEEAFVDDTRYARCFVRDKFRYNKWGRLKIKQALLQKHIGNSQIEAGLHEIDDDEYEKVLKELLKVKNKTVKAADTYERRAKLMRFVVGRGFEPDLAMGCLRTMQLDES